MIDMNDDLVNRRMPKLVNRTAARKFIFEMIKLLRPGLEKKMTQVSEDVYDYLDTSIRTDIRNLVASHPSKGKTITTGIKKRRTEDG